jgi:hypothetical protein
MQYLFLPRNKDISLPLHKQLAERFLGKFNRLL